MCYNEIMYLYRNTRNWFEYSKTEYLSKHTEIGAQNIRIDSRNPTEEEFLQFHLTSSHNYSK